VAKSDGVVTSARGAPVADALRVLLTGAIDYAGLFPPAQLDMPGAAAEYAAYLASPDAWALGRFVIPAARLDELVIAASAAIAGGEWASPDGTVQWHLSALLGGDITTDLDRVLAFNEARATRQAGWYAVVDAVELRASTAADVAAAGRAVGDAFECYIEVAVDGDPTPLVSAIAAAGARAKVRTGGTTRDAFPTVAELARFLGVCVEARVPFKATAGLHHPLRGEYALTYAAESARGTMFGFLNVFLAAALLRAGAGEAVAREALDEADPRSVRFDDAGVVWREHRLTHAQLADARARAVTSFGSCSFREPLDDLAALGMR
jgi:hypothetical protein